MFWRKGRSRTLRRLINLAVQCRQYELRSYTALTEIEAENAEALKRKAEEEIVVLRRQLKDEGLSAADVEAEVSASPRIRALEAALASARIACRPSLAG